MPNSRRGLFWRTLKVAGKEAFAFLTCVDAVPFWIVWGFLWLVVAGLAAGAKHPNAVVGLTAITLSLLAPLVFAVYLILIIAHDLRAWWSRCRARAQGAE